MGRRHPNHRLVKTHRSYTVEEIARLLDVHKNTVRNWLRDGLATVDDRRPTLVLGSVLIAHLKARRTRNKRKLRPGEFYCVRCRDAVRPAGDMAEYVPITDSGGNLRGICPACDLLIHRRVSLSRITESVGDLEVTIDQAERHITGSTAPTVNCDSSKGAKARGNA